MANPTGTHFHLLLLCLLALSAASGSIATAGASSSAIASSALLKEERLVLKPRAATRRPLHRGLPQQHGRTNSPTHGNTAAPSSPYPSSSSDSSSPSSSSSSSSPMQEEYRHDHRDLHDHHDHHDRHDHEHLLHHHRRALQNASSGATAGGDPKRKPAAIRWLVGVALGVASGLVTAALLTAGVRFTRGCVGRAGRAGGRAGRPVVYQRIIDAKSIAFLQDEGRGGSNNNNDNNNNNDGGNGSGSGGKSNDRDAVEGLEVIGRGACGCVYKATLALAPKPGRPGSASSAAATTKVVAIKKVHGSGLVGEQSRDNNNNNNYYHYYYYAAKRVPAAAKQRKARKKQGAAPPMPDAEDAGSGSPPEGSRERARPAMLTKRSAQIRAEMDTLGRVRHRNLVTLLAYVPRPRSHLLVYEFMPNGSLSDALNKVKSGALRLDWPRRHAIALGVARALKYLHCDARPRIIHRDIKPGNILLDHDMEPRLGDFGLAKLIADGTTHVTGSDWAGTVGFVAPEYTTSLRFTDKGDVYAFGVVLVVLLTNRPPSDDLFSNESNYLGAWAAATVEAGPRCILDVLDPRLFEADAPGGAGGGDGFEEQMLLTFRIAAFCLAKSPASRPSSADVLEMLNQVSMATAAAPLS